MRYLHQYNKFITLKENANFESEEQIINDILLELKDSNFHIEMREEETDNPNKTFLMLRIQYDLDPEDEMWNLPRAYHVPILSEHTFQWNSVKDTVLRLVDVVEDLPDIDLYFMKYAKIQDMDDFDRTLSTHKVEFIYSRGDGDDLSIINSADVKGEIQFVDIVFVKELK